MDSAGNPITQLESPLTICLPRPNNTKKSEKVCLSFFDEKKGEWRCQDECLSTDGKEDLICGTTDHLTNFALLLSGRSGKDDPCASGNENFVIAWLSLSFVGGAIVVVILSGVVIEISVRRKTNRRDRLLSRLRSSPPPHYSLLPGNLRNITVLESGGDFLIRF